MRVMIIFNNKKGGFLWPALYICILPWLVLGLYMPSSPYRATFSELAVHAETPAGRGWEGGGAEEELT